MKLLDSKIGILEPVPQPRWRNYSLPSGEIGLPKLQLCCNERCDISVAVSAVPKSCATLSHCNRFVAKSLKTSDMVGHKPIPNDSGEIVGRECLKYSGLMNLKIF